MSLITLRTCDVDQRPMTRVVEIRMVVIVDEADGRHAERDLRVEVCSPACGLTAARAVIERAFHATEGR